MRPMSKGLGTKLDRSGPIRGILPTRTRNARYVKEIDYSCRRVNRGLLVLKVAMAMAMAIPMSLSV